MHNISFIFTIETGILYLRALNFSQEREGGGGYIDAESLKGILREYFEEPLNRQMN